MTVRAIVTDIEGTTSSIRFVHDVLFPYSRTRLADYVRTHADDLGALLDDVRAAAEAPAPDVEACIAQLLEWHDADRKIGPLKTLQALIWEEGFRTGAFTGHVYPDAADALRRWHASGISIYIYSSGAVAAQKLLFGHSDLGDLTPIFSGYFDTAVGAKRNPESYRAIARAIGGDPTTILFLSDVQEELAAAREAGLAVILVAREGEPVTSPFPTVTTFDAITLGKAPA